MSASAWRPGFSVRSQAVGPDSPKSTPPGARTSAMRTPGMMSCGSRVYAKVDVEGRADLAAQVARGDL
jgi:hypothetical protein